MFDFNVLSVYGVRLTVLGFCSSFSSISVIGNIFRLLTDKVQNSGFTMLNRKLR